MKRFLENLIKIGLYLCLLTPLLFWRTFMYPFITLKVNVFQILVGVIILLWIILAVFLFSEKAKTKTSKYSLTNFLLLFLIVLFFVSLIGIDFQRSFFSTSERGIGLFALLYFFAFFLVLSDFIKRKLLDWRKYLLASFAISLVMAGLAFYQTQNPAFFFVASGERPGATLGNPIFLASYLLLHIFIGFLLMREFYGTEYRKVHRKVCKIGLVGLSLGIGFLVYSIFLTETRGAILGLFSGLVFLFLYFSIFSLAGQSSLQKRNKIIFASFLILLLSFSVCFWATRDNSFWQRIPGIRRMTNISISDPSVQPRLLSWGAALDGVKERPIFGWGFENYRYAFDKHFTPALLKFGWAEAFWDKPHNIFLEYLISGGIIGLLAYLLVFVMAFWILLRKRLFLSPFLGACLVGYLVTNAFNFDTFGSYLMLFIVFAMIQSKSKEVPCKEVSLPYIQRIGYFGFLILPIIVIYFLYLNSSILYFNRRHYFGLNYFVHKRSEQGLAEFKIALEPSYPYINETRASFASIVRKTAEQTDLPDKEKNISWAIEELKKAVAEKPNDYLLNVKLADMITEFYFLDPSYFEIGVQASEKALELSPTRQQALFVAGKIAFLTGEKEKAYERIKKAVELEPGIAEPHFYLGLIALEAGKKEQGFQAIETAKKMGRHSQRFLESRVLADHFADEQKFEQAIYYYNRALAQAINNSEKAEVKLKMGVIYILQEQFEPGLVLIEEAINLSPEIKKSQFYLQIKDVFGL